MVLENYYYKSEPNLLQEYMNVQESISLPLACVQQSSNIDNRLKKRLKKGSSDLTLQNTVPKKKSVIQNYKNMCHGIVNNQVGEKSKA